ncbi:MAG: reactive intermediate/imine deaminase [Crocinitomicaceae bacterium]|nr:reactive intermediate/imine deaminase [Crocinitomicaceae bacterium]
MQKKAIKIKNAPAPVGPYSQAILAGETLYVSGQIPLDPNTGKLISGNISSCTTQVMTNIKSLLEAAEMNLNNVVKCSIFLKDMNDFEKVNKVYSGYFSSTPPARETVQVSKLPLDVDVEISCIAIKGSVE